MPTLLQINVDSAVCSCGKICEDISRLAQSRGWETYIAYGREHKPGVNKEIRIGNKFDVYLHWFIQRIWDNEGLCSIRPTRRLIKEIVKINPDVIHLHNLHDHYINYKILFDYLNTTSIKVVWTMHDFWPITGHCMHFTSVSCNRWKTVCYDCLMRGKYPKSLLDRSERNFLLKKHCFANNKNLTIVTVSDWVYSVMKDSFLSEKNMLVINNGVDTAVFKPTVLDIDKYKISDGLFVILGVASQWAVDKGLDDFIQLSKIIADNEVIVLVGVNDKIKKRLPDNIIAINKTDNQTELAGLYTRADVLVSFSAAETFGMTIIEGFACGTPAIVYNNTALPYLITGNTGFVVENHNYKAAYDCIKLVKEKGRSYYSQACIQEALEKYDKSRNYKGYINLYDSLIR